MKRDSEKKVPELVIYLQICGNISWITSSTIRNDPFLGTTALCSLMMQCATAIILNNTNKKHRSTKLTDSTDELPSF